MWICARRQIEDRCLRTNAVALARMDPSTLVTLPSGYEEELSTIRKPNGEYVRVYRDGRTYQATSLITRRYLGQFATNVEAAVAVVKDAKELQPEYFTRRRAKMPMSLDPPAKNVHVGLAQERLQVLATEALRESGPIGREMVEGEEAVEAAKDYWAMEGVDAIASNEGGDRGVELSPPDFALQEEDGPDLRLSVSDLVDVVTVSPPSGACEEVNDEAQPASATTNLDELSIVTSFYLHEVRNEIRKKRSRTAMRRGCMHAADLGDASRIKWESIEREERAAWHAAVALSDNSRPTPQMFIKALCNHGVHCKSYKAAAMRLARAEQKVRRFRRGRPRPSPRSARVSHPRRPKNSTALLSRARRCDPSANTAFSCDDRPPPRRSDWSGVGGARTARGRRAHHV